MEVYATIDWISVTAPLTKTEEKQSVFIHPRIIDTPSVEVKARNGYTLAHKHSCGAVVMQNPDRPDMGYHTIYTSQTLKALQNDYDLDALSILRWHYQQVHKIRRLDIAVDTINSGLSIFALFQLCENGGGITQARKHTLVGSEADGFTLYVGSTKARKKLLRIYDKGKETKAGGDWKRAELEMKGTIAQNCALLLLNDSEWHIAIKRIIKGFWHCHNPEWIAIFSSLTLKVPVDIKVEGQTWLWLTKQCAPALAKEIILDPEKEHLFMGHVRGLVEEMKSGKRHD